jgi:hypothetical protein
MPNGGSIPGALFGRIALGGTLAFAFFPSSALAGQSARLVYSRTNEAVNCSDEHGLREARQQSVGEHQG